MFFFKQKRLIPSQLILLMGGPGSGKGVLARNLSPLKHISIGEELRHITSLNHDSLSETIFQSMQQGKLLDDDIIFDIVEKSMQRELNQTILLDGFPRTFSQWNLLKNSRYPIAGIIDLQVSEQVLIERLLMRKRADDKPDVIKKRIYDYFENTKPMAKMIIAENKSITCQIECESLTPEETAEIAREFLQSLDLFQLKLSQELSS